MHLPGTTARRRALSPLTLLALLSLFLSTASAAVLGIDLGTEYIKAALVGPGIPLEILFTKDSKRKEAAAVAFKPGKTKASSDKGTFPERLYGGDALALSARFPGDSFLNIKSLLGVSAADPAVARYSERYPGATVEREQVRDSVTLRSGASFASDEMPFDIEELLAMQFQNIVANAEAVAHGKIKDVVIAVPAFWTVEEKDAVRWAADLADLNVLSLTTDGLAVGINYAMTRTFATVNDGSGAQPEYHIVYDMGAGGTTATVLRMQGRTVKDVGRFNKTVQEVQVAGMGYDKDFGGDALNTLILNDMLDKLAEDPKVKALGAGRDALAKDARTVSKLWKESQRLRLVLSANAESSTSLEAIYDDSVTFKYKIKRAEFEKLAEDYVGRVKGPIDMALYSARVEFSDINSIIVHGGAYRTPFVHEALKVALEGRNMVSYNVNPDEAAAFGAAFLGASMSPSFRVKDIRASEAGVHDVWISWVQDGKDMKQRIFMDSSQSGVVKQLPFKLKEDFSFDVYQRVLDGDGMRDIPVWHIETTNLTNAVKQITDKHGCAADDVRTEFEVILNQSDNIPEVLRAAVSCEIADDEKKGGIVDGIKGLFGGKKSDQKVLGDDESASASAESSSSSTKAESSSKTSSGSESSATAAAESDKPSAPKKKTVKVHVGFLNGDTVRTKQVSHMEFRRVKERLAAFKKSDDSRAARFEALNQLEAYTYRVRDLADSESFVAASTDAQRRVVADKSSEASDWLYGDGAEASQEEFEARLRELKALVAPIERRRDEAARRPEAIEGLEAALDSTRKLLDGMRVTADQAMSEYDSSVSSASVAATASPEASEEVEAEAPSAKEDELDELDDLDDDKSLSSSSATTTTSAPPLPSPAVTVADVDAALAALAETEAWLAERRAAQAKLAPSDDPVLTADELGERQRDLTRTSASLLQKQLRAQAARAAGDDAAKTKSSKAAKAKSKAKSAKAKTKSKPAKSKAGSSSASSSSTTTTASAKSDAKDEL